MDEPSFETLAQIHLSELANVDPSNGDSELLEAIKIIVQLEDKMQSEALAALTYFEVSLMAALSLKARSDMVNACRIYSLNEFAFAVKAAVNSSNKFELAHTRAQKYIRDHSLEETRREAPKKLDDHNALRMLSAEAIENLAESKPLISEDLDLLYWGVMFLKGYPKQRAPKQAGQPANNAIRDKRIAKAVDAIATNFQISPTANEATSTTSASEMFSMAWNAIANLDEIALGALGALRVQEIWTENRVR